MFIPVHATVSPFDINAGDYAPPSLEFYTVNLSQVITLQPVGTHEFWHNSVLQSGPFVKAIFPSLTLYISGNLPEIIARSPL